MNNLESIENGWVNLLSSCIKSPSILHYRGIKKYLISFYKDAVLVFFVSLFYKNKEKYQTFSNFVKQFSFEVYPNPLLLQFLLNHFVIIEELVLFFSTNISNLVDIQIMGDVHGPYSTKVLLIFCDGSRKIATGNQYSSDNDVLMLFEHFSNSLCASSPRYIASGTILMRDYLEYSNHFSSKGELENFYFILGLKSAFLLSLRTIDLHYENLLISSNCPYFFDFECVCSPEITDEEYSVILSGILDNEVYGEKFGAIFGGRGDRKSLLTPILSDYGNNPSIRRTVPSRYKNIHFPESENLSIIPSDFRDFFLKGIETMSEKILKDKKRLLDGIVTKTLYNRILFRPTRVYLALIKDMLMRVSLEEYYDIDTFFYERLIKLPIFTSIENKEILINEEIKSLKIGLIPSFYSDIHDVAVRRESGEKNIKLRASCRCVFEKHFNSLDVFFRKVVKDISRVYEQEKTLEGQDGGIVK